MLRLADIQLLVAPVRIPATDTDDTLEAALPDLTASIAGRLRLPERRIFERSS